MSNIKVGNRVRATCGESVIIGTVDGAYPEGYAPGFAIAVDGDISRYFASDEWSFVVLAPPIPDVVGTIVRDNDGDAWQRDDEFWRCWSSVYYKYTLADLQFRYGPLTVLWTPEVTPCD